ncbi:MAG: putative bifunctional diguanylate cyclase/phosphodiesterase [Arenibacterium sp.]
MSKPGLLARFRAQIAPSLTGPPALAFLPAVTLGAFWLGGERALVLASLSVPLFFAFIGAFSRHQTTLTGLRDNVTGFVLQEGFNIKLDQFFTKTDGSGLQSVCMVIHLDDFPELATRYGQEAMDRIARQIGERIQSTVRDADVIARLNDHRFSLCTSPVQNLDLEGSIMLAGRIQSCVEEPISLDGITVYVSCSIGFCTRRKAPGKTPADWFNAAETALKTALQYGPSSIRSFAPANTASSYVHSDLLDEALDALENGHIVPWFQPQISTDTGHVTGFEALARWNHPVHGTLPAEDFMTVMEEASLLPKLTRVVLLHAFTALKAWDNSGLNVPCISVNFDRGELRDPSLIDRLTWEFDRFDLTPDRLVVEILETVMTDNPDDVISRNIVALRDLGCRIDLDDFGTGHASIASIRRFGFARIKIDRSFVMRADQDPEQQRLVGAILTMAERLELETLAEGVETVGEHALLAQLGCNHVQGFGIGRPMPFEKTLEWIRLHNAKLEDAPQIGREAG